MLGLKVTLDYERCFSSARVIVSNGTNANEDDDLSAEETINPDDKDIVPRKQICYRDKVRLNL